MDFGKYDPLQKKIKSDPEAGFTAADDDDHSQAPGARSGWMVSAPMILLIEYLDKHPGLGANIHVRGDDTLWISFRPGISRADLDNGRGQVAKNMIDLLRTATPDLHAMIADNIEIPFLIKHPNRKAVQSWT